MLFVRTLKSLLAIATLTIILTISFGLIHPQIAVAQTEQMENIQTRSPQALEFKNLIDASYAAWNTHNPDALSKFYAKDNDLVFYDALPLQYKGWADYKAGIQKNLFDKMPKFKLSANDDLRVTRKGDLAWTTFTWHLSAQLKDGTPIETDGRQTDIWEKRNGKWLIVHEHISAPVST
ncbi:MAG: DUF4440 domain-containing protein [Hydrococcus sp. Prado102]|nr:DUF4440 domain-containing protein [Hydrococcus sp. Prado102]